MKTLAALAAVVMLTGCAVFQHASAVKPHRFSTHAGGTVTHAVKPKYYIGVREQAFPPSWGAVSGFEKATGVTPRLVLWYMAWGGPFPQRFAVDAAAHGALPLIQLAPNKPLSNIAKGRYDSYIRSLAETVRAYRHPLVIGFGHEMNGSWYPWGYGHQSPKAFIAAWRHVVEVFRRAKANNVIWMWTVSHSFPQRYRSYWPGSKYVSWVGIDGYLDTPRATFKTVFGPALTAARQLTRKPVLLAETAVSPGTHRQAPDIVSVFAAIKHYHLLGLVYYDVNQIHATGHQEWRLEGDQAALRAFRQGIKSLG